ncbi:response regulator transcription factor [Streptomyces sp. NBC_01381]|uniref:response regulator transcription factor n=1 Tax=Streptomyces sp. NBC_01381 TaxID=2903845 RepID=UPI00225B1930|nr:response regulator transcription factor [Streptomyces sp. NBC_01381]MCX4670996.1 response regulator transcription factor [Streptomyces sp. NBC_01381]
MRVVIAEDSALLRQGIVLLLRDAGIDVVDAVGDGEALLRSVAEHRPDVCVVDVRMPPTFVDEGLRAALVIRNRWPETGVLVLSQYVEQSYAVDLIESATSGVGYLLKDRVSDADEFVDGLRRVRAGDTVLDPEVVKQMLARSRRQDPMATLSPRERDVLAAMAEGRSNTGIADELCVGSAAVEKHIRSIFVKFGLHPEDGEHRRVLAVLRYLGA